MLEPARLLLMSLLTGVPLGAAAAELTDPNHIDDLAEAFDELPGVLSMGLTAREVHLNHAPLQVARETLSVVAPLADRAGFAPLRATLEDHSFARLEPVTFASLRQALGPDPSIEPLVERARALLASAGVHAQVSGRVKSLYGVHRKMTRKGVAPEQVYDRVGLRAIVPTQHDCYTAIQAAHQTFQPVEGEYDDYIAHPKPSGYRSLHTAVRVPGAGVVELQVRTPTMHEEAERGDAAHWRYKLG